MVQVAVVQVIHVAVMLERGVAAVGPVLVVVVVMSGGMFRVHKQK